MADNNENLPASKMAHKFLGAEPMEEVEPDYPYNSFRKEFRFYYGTLMDPSTLAKVLNIKDRPQLIPAKVIGYQCMLWGPYPALVDGPSRVAVHGLAYEVQSAKEAELLQAYETNHYARTACIIYMNRKRVLGRTFGWKGKKDDLKKGVFDLKDWQMLSWNAKVEIISTYRVLKYRSTSQIVVEKKLDNLSKPFRIPSLHTTQPTLCLPIKSVRGGSYVEYQQTLVVRYLSLVPTKSSSYNRFRQQCLKVYLKDMSLLVETITVEEGAGEHDAVFKLSLHG